MNTHGHAEVARDAGLPLLREAFGELNSLEAMHLGNWLTDVSQAVDPVAYASAARKVDRGGRTAADALKTGVGRVVDEILGAMTSRLPDVVARGPVRAVVERFRDLLGAKAEAAKQELDGAFAELIGGKTEERDSPLGEFFRSVFLVIGYFKFVHPDAEGQPPRMNFECFMRVFGRRTDARGAAGPNREATDRPGAYTQYYPHEHLDRPEKCFYVNAKPGESAAPPDPAVYEPGEQKNGERFTLSPGARKGTRAGTHEPLDPDLYSYLRDFMEMTAGLLAEVDRDLRLILGGLGLKPPFADRERLRALETNPEWHLCLAKLGHALHQVEDFFAHSNWIELATAGRGSAHEAKVLAEPPAGLVKALDPAISKDLLNRSRTVYEKRLRRHLTEQLDDWRKHEPPETWVVTGYFDFQDTALSLAHLSEEVLGLDAADPWASLHEDLQKLQEAREKPSAAARKARDLLRQALEFLDDPKAAARDRDNEVARAWRDRVGDDLERLSRPEVKEDLAKRIAAESPLLANVPPETREAFLSALVIGSRARAGISLFKALKTVIKAVTNPVGWLLDFLPMKPKDFIVFHARERVYDWVAMNRIGCHSLMAKDHGLEPLYEPNKQCATAVHYVVVKTLLRFRQDGAPAWIDWLELLEFFLRNPATPGRRPTPRRSRAATTIEYMVRKDDQLDSPDERHSLTKRFRKTAVNPTKFTWRTIADANFATTGLSDDDARRIINQTLRDRGWGVPVSPPNYAFKPGLILIIPDQPAERSATEPEPPPAGGEPPWFHRVMDADWKVFRGGKDPRTGAKVEPLTPYSPAAVGKDRADAVIHRGSELRIKARRAYRPATTTATTRGPQGP